MAQETEVPLFLPASVSRDTKEPQRPERVHHQTEIDVQFGALLRPADLQRGEILDLHTGFSSKGRQFVSQGNRFSLNLFNGIHQVLVLDSAENAGPDGETISWKGSIEGIQHSEVTMVSGNDILQGNIFIPGQGHFHIRYQPGGGHVLRKVDQSGYPPERCSHLPEEPVSEPEQSEGDAPGTGGETGGDIPPVLRYDETGSNIDVMVVYSPGARAAVGGTVAIHALIDLAVAETNTGYSNSGVVQRITLVHREEVAYDEATATYGSYTDPFDIALYCLKDPSDGIIDNVHDLRDDYGADMVSLLINDHTWCGIGYVMYTESHDFQDRAFSVCDWDCATGYYSFAHEMGHNQGGKHDRPHDNANGVFSYSHGYQDPDEDFRTIMSYNCPGGCTRVNHWSNPDVEYLNFGPTGILYTESDSADMRRSHNNTRDTVANWRPKYIHVDLNYSGVENGLSATPFNTLSEGVGKIGRFYTGARLYVAPGIYTGPGNEPILIDKPMEIRPWGSGTIEIR